MNFSVLLDDRKCGESGNPAVSERKLKCYFCEKDHKLEICEAFKKKDGLQQSKLVRSKKLCDNCYLHFIFLLVANVGKSAKFLDVI